jgi:hypothetical protein
LPPMRAARSLKPCCSSPVSVPPAIMV